MVSEYIDISNALPTLATEVVHRVAEILKSYNQRTCQLVLGAGAMQVWMTEVALLNVGHRSSFVHRFFPCIGSWAFPQ